MNNQRPLVPQFLKDYSVFDRLEEWQVSGDWEEKRHFCIRSCKMSDAYHGFDCELTWNLLQSGGDRACATIRRVELCPEEAVYLALKEFERIQMDDGPY